MRLVISDTGPINYLMLIGHIDILPALFKKVYIPVALHEELKDPDAPPEVLNWIARPPAWLEVRQAPPHIFDTDLFSVLDEGERQAIALASALQTDTLLLMDERAGVRAARSQGLAVTGTIGILEEASQHGLLDLEDAFARLRRTTFRCSETLMQRVLAEQKNKRE